MSVNFDSNSRTFSSVHDVGIVNIPSSKQVKRIASAALPFIYLYKPAQNLLTAAFALLYIKKAVTDLMEDVRTKNWDQLHTHLYEMAIPTGMHVLTFFAPRLMQSVVVLQNVNKLYQAKTSEERRNAVFELISSLIYLGSKCSSRKEFLFLSLAFEALSDFRRSYQEFAEGRYLEGFSNAILGTIRGYSARKPLFTLKREYFGKEMDQKTWDALKLQLLTEADAVLDVEQYMIDNDYKPLLDRITLFGEKNGIERYRFKNLQFNKCDFQENYFVYDRFENVTFNQCNCRDADFFGCLFDKVAFKGCDLRGASFARTSSFQLSFSDSDLRGVCFNDSVHRQFSIENSLVEGTNFLGGVFHDALMKACNLTNCLLTTAQNQFCYESCTKNIFTKPVVALTWSFEEPQNFAGKIDSVLQEKDMVVLKFELAPADIDLKKLQGEINVLAQKADVTKLKKQSRVEFMMSQREVGSEIDKIAKKAAVINQYSSAIVLSGGLDVDEVFYKRGRLLEDQDLRDGETKRSVMEFALIGEVDKTNKPLLGTCRGCQVTNVYYDGTLKDVDPDEHVGVVEKYDFVRTREQTARVVQRLFPGGITGWSGHHQACDGIGRDLVVVAQQGAVPKLLVNKRGNILLTQFHPEVFPEVKELLEPGYLEKTIQEIRDDWGSFLSEDEIEEEIEECIQEYNHILGLAPEMLKNERLYDFFLDKVRAYAKATKRVVAAAAA